MHVCITTSWLLEIKTFLLVVFYLNVLSIFAKWVKLQLKTFIFVFLFRFYPRKRVPLTFIMRYYRQRHLTLKYSSKIILSMQVTAQLGLWFLSDFSEILKKLSAYLYQTENFENVELQPLNLSVINKIWLTIARFV